MIKYISDLHFFRQEATIDTTIPYYKARGFATVSEMNNTIIERFNKTVSNQDTCIILGDFSDGNAKETEDILKKLNGKKILLLGNHDDIIIKNKNLQKYFTQIEQYLEIIDGGNKIVCGHYPMLWYNKSKTGDCMFHGHIHDLPVDLEIMYNIEKTIKEKSIGAHFDCTFVNCYADFSDFCPLTKDEWLKIHGKH